MLHQSNEELQAAGTPVGETVVVGLGHNTLWERDRARFDNWAGKFDREADELLATLERLGAEQIVWVTLREPSESVIPPQGRKQYELYVWYFPYVNERLDAARPAPPGRRPRRLGRGVQRGRADLRRDAPDVRGIRLMIDTIRSAGGI